MPETDLAVYIAIEINRCPRCLRRGTISSRGKDATTAFGICSFCEAVVRIVPVKVEVPEED